MATFSQSFKNISCYYYISRSESERYFPCDLKTSHVTIIYGIGLLRQCFQDYLKTSHVTII